MSCFDRGRVRGVSFQLAFARLVQLRKLNVYATCAALLLALPATSKAVELPKQLTTDGLLKRDPVYSPDGKSVVFSIRHQSPRLVLMQLDLATSEQTRFHPASTLVELRPSFSRDARQFLFLRMTGNDECSLFLEDRIRKSERKLPVSKKVTWNASISPDGRTAVYNLAGQLYRWDFSANREHPLPKSSGRNDWPAISPDNQRLAFVSSRSGNYDIYTSKIDGSDAVQITRHTSMDVRPAWSPDGKWIAFTSRRHGNPEVYVIPATGGKAIRMTNHEERDDYPTWHPDGNRILTVSERLGRHDLFEWPFTKLTRERQAETAQ